jgi:hypothetical protein
MHGPLSIVAHDNAVSGYKNHMFVGEDNTDAGDGDPIKGIDGPDAGEGGDDSLNEADLRDQFRNDSEYLPSPFGLPQVDVVHAPSQERMKCIHQVQVWVDRPYKMGEGKGYPYWEISFLQAVR